LDVEFSVDGFAMRVMGLHLPSPQRPASFRIDAVKFIESLYLKDPVATIIAGDWNVPSKEEAKEKTFASLRKSFHISDDMIRASSTDRGSTYYKKEKTWSFLDKIALSRNSFDSVTCKVVGYLPGQRDRTSGAPLSFPLFAKSGEGVSDHLPVLCRASF
jgi:endonuclease/exonuclease/phosphatase family metal-dependent hydrolase